MLAAMLFALALAWPLSNHTEIIAVPVKYAVLHSSRTPATTNKNATEATEIGISETVSLRTFKTHL